MATTQDYPSLEFSVDYGGSIGEKNLRFEFSLGESGVGTFDDEIVRDWLAENTFRNVLAAIENARKDEDVSGAGVFINISGSDPRLWRLDFQSPGNTTKPGGSTEYQWGSSSDPNDGPNVHTATGATDPTIQQAVFMEALDRAAIDSRNPATFAYKHYSPGGHFDEKKVVVSEPSTSMPNDQPSAFTGSLALISAKDLREATQDATLRPE